LRFEIHLECGRSSAPITDIGILWITAGFVSIEASIRRLKQIIVS
jgi:hypothetical protein